MKTFRDRTIRHYRFPIILLVAIVALAGCDPPKLDPNPATPLDFGQVYIGTSMPRPASWVNSGSTDATVPQITIGGANAANFAAIIPAPPARAAKNGGPLGPPPILLFTPPTVGQFAATATPQVNEANATATARSLQGEGIAQYPVGDLTVGGQPIRVGQPVNFGRVRVGAVSPVVRFDIVNPIGAQNITVTKISFHANNQGFAVIAPPVPFQVPRGGRTQVQMTFTPPAWNPPPLEKMFRDGVTFFEVRTDAFGNITAGKSATGVALCGVGFHPSETPPNPPMTCP